MRPGRQNTAGKPHAGLATARQSAAVTADSDGPSASSWLRRMWVDEKSVFASVNQSGLSLVRGELGRGCLKSPRPRPQPDVLSFDCPRPGCT